MQRSRRQAIRWSAALGILTVLSAILSACEHAEPFAGGAPTLDEPLGATVPVRLTFNPDADVAPSWLPDGSGLLYSFRLPESAEADRCLGLLPPGGGTLRRQICARTDPGHDSTTSYGEPAAGPDGLIAYTRASRPRGAVNDAAAELVVAPLADPLAVTVVTSLPLPGPAGRPLPLASSLRWLGPGRLAFVAGANESVHLTPDFTILLPVGQAIIVADLGPGAPVRRAMAGLAGNPTSVSAGESPDVVYYTVAGDSRVYRQGVTDAAPTVAYDFGGGRVARDVHVQGSRLAAVIDGKLRVVVDPTFGAAQLDDGGVLALVDRASGTARMLELPPGTSPAGSRGLFFRRPALSPTADAVAADATPFSLVSRGDGTTDTMLSGTADLWLYAHP